MATASSWRSGNGPRWSQGAAGGGPANHQSSPAGANSVPRSVSTSNNSRASGNDGNEATEAEAVQRDRMLYLLVGLIGNTVVVTTRSGVKYVGILSSTSTPSGDSQPLGAVLSCAQQVFNDGALGPLKKMLVVKGEDLDGLSAKSVGLDVPVSMSSSNRAGFRTDTEISRKALEPFGEGRALQKWADDVDDLPLEGGGGGLSNTGSSTAGGWDQFAANEARFGVKSNYEETLYTTKLDKSSKDYKERERKADQLAKEIMGSTTNNIHIAEERGLAAQGDGQTEEDLYGAVVRGPNAYVPPAARRAGAVASNGAGRADKGDVSQPQQADGTALAPIQIPTITSTPAAKEETAGSSAVAKPAQAHPDAVGDFRQFVSSERERLEKKKAALAKKEKDSKLADLKNWGDKFKLKFPVSADSSGSTISSVTQSGDAVDKNGTQLVKSISPSAEPTAQKPVTGATNGTASVGPSPTAGNVKPAPVVSTTPKTAAMPMADAKATMSRMTIPKIPPFNADKARARQSENNAANASLSTGVAAQASPAAEPASASKSAFKLSAKASSFKPFNPTAAAFTPGGAGVGAGAAPAPVPAPAAAASPSIASASSTPAVIKLPAAGPPAVVVPSNPFFGNRVLKKHTSLHVREDFNPFKNAKVPESQAVGPTWGFTGKAYRNLFQVVSADEPGSSSTGSVNAAILPTGVAVPQHMMHMGMHPPHVAAMGQPMSSGRPHMQQQQPPLHQHQQQLNQAAAAAAAAAAMSPHGGQPFYMPYGAAQQGGQYRFQGQPMQHIPAGYGQMPPQYMAFSPQMQPSGVPPPGQMYSPQMGQMFQHGASMHAMGGGAPAQMAGAGPPRNGPPGKGAPPPQMYYPHVPFVPGAAPSTGGPMSPGMRHQQSQSMQQQQQQPPQQQQPSKDPSQHSGTPSQAGSTTG